MHTKASTQEEEAFSRCVSDGARSFCLASSYERKNIKKKTQIEQQEWHISVRIQNGIFFKSVFALPFAFSFRSPSLRPPPLNLLFQAPKSFRVAVLYAVSVQCNVCSGMRVHSGTTVPSMTTLVTSFQSNPLTDAYSAAVRSPQ